MTPTDPNDEAAQPVDGSDAPQPAAAELDAPQAPSPSIATETQPSGEDLAASGPRTEVIYRVVDNLPPIVRVIE